MSTLEPERRVSWGEVIGGILLALTIGVFATFGGFLAGLFVMDSTKTAFLGGAAGFVVPLLVYSPALLLRKRMPDLCRGILIGACIVIIIGGGCNALLVGDFGRGFH